MKRRKFISDSAKLFAAPLVIQGNQLKALSGLDFPINVCNLKPDRCMVIIKLGGGNDGLNSFVPLSQYTQYAKIRPTIKLASTDLIELDKNLGSDYSLGLHPKLKGLKDLYEQDLTVRGTSKTVKVNMNVINSVSYPNASRSHFRSTDLMLKGLSGTETQDASKEETTGWMARFLNSGYDPSKALDPLGIQLGNSQPSLGFRHDNEHTISLNLSGQDLQGYYSLIQNFDSAYIYSGVSRKEMKDMKEAVDHILGIEADMNTYGKRITDVFNKGSNSSVSYSSTSIANQLKTVARLIKGGSTTKIFLCHMGGFDTHSSQLTRHAELMTDLNEAISSFYQDLVDLGIAEQVLTTSFSEFGRKAVENGNTSGGTDHGTLAPMLVFGTNVVNGVTGKNPDLTNLTSSGQLQEHSNNPVQDYRKVFTTLIQDWLGASSTDLSNTLFDDFGSSKLNLIDSDYRVPSSCYNGTENQLLEKWSAKKTNEESELYQFEASVYPNPSASHFNIRIHAPYEAVDKLRIMDINGRMVKEHEITLKRGLNTFKYEHTYRSGAYFIQILDEQNNLLKQLSLIVRN
jgi:uncharacterized protein (DUF1501 family)